MLQSTYLYTGAANIYIKLVINVIIIYMVYVFFFTHYVLKKFIYFYVIVVHVLVLLYMLDDVLSNLSNFMNYFFLTNYINL